MRREYPQAPLVGVGAVIIRDGHVLLVCRANEPNRGQWSIPGGAVELGETLAQAAAREAWEESQVRVEPGTVLATFDLIRRDAQERVLYHYVLLDLAARYISGDPVAGTDALAVRWATAAELDQLDIIPRLVPVLRRALRQAATASRHQSGEAATASRHRSGEAATASRHRSGEAATASRHRSGEAATASRHQSGETA